MPASHARISSVHMNGDGDVVAVSGLICARERPPGVRRQGPAHVMACGTGYRQIVRPLPRIYMCQRILYQIGEASVAVAKGDVGDPVHGRHAPGRSGDPEVAVPLLPGEYGVNDLGGFGGIGVPVPPACLHADDPDRHRDQDDEHHGVRDGREPVPVHPKTTTVISVGILPP